MKKILFLLLCTVSIYGQTSTGQEQEFDYGIKNNSTQTITTPPYLTTTGMDGTQGKIPSALIAKTSDIADSLATKENIANKSDSYTASSSITYASTKALVEGLGTKQNTLTNPVTGTFVAGRVPYSSSNSTLTDSSKLLWNNTNSYFEVNGNAPRFTLKNNLNNYSTYFTNNVNGILFLKNHQDKTLAVFSNPVNSTSQPQMAIGNVSSIPTESQLYVYGGMNGANIDARGSATVDEANIDLEGNDWTTSPNSLGFSYFGSSATAFGTMMGYAKNKLGVIRFQDTNYAIINSDKSTGISPIRFGINQIEIGNVNDKGFSYQSDFSSVNSSNLRWLADKGYVDTKAPLSGSTNYIQNQNASAQSANMWISGDVKARAGAFSSYVDVLGTVSGGNNFIANTGGLYFNGYNNYNAGIFSNTSGTGLSFQTGGNIALNLAPSGAATFSSTVTAPTFIGSLSGNASSASNATAFGGFPYGGVYSSGTLYYSTLFNSTSNEFQLADQSATRTFLGLGSNAYTSTAYLPLSGGTLSGALNGTSATFSSSVMATKLSASSLAIGTQTLLELGEPGYVATNYGSVLESSSATGLFSLFNYNAGVKSTTPVLSWSRVNSNMTFGGAATFSGTVTATSFNGSATLTGTPTAPTAAPGTTGKQIATLDYVLANSGATSGNYTPTLTNLVNCSSLTVASATYMKVGNIVNVMIYITGTITANTTSTSLNVSLPVNRSGSNSIPCGNGGIFYNTNFTAFPANVTVITGNVVRLSGISPGAGAGAGGKLTLSFQYDVTN